MEKKLLLSGKRFWFIVYGLRFAHTYIRLTNFKHLFHFYK